MISLTIRARGEVAYNCGVNIGHFGSRNGRIDYGFNINAGVSGDIRPQFLIGPTNDSNDWLEWYVGFDALTQAVGVRVGADIPGIRQGLGPTGTITFEAIDMRLALVAKAGGLGSIQRILADPAPAYESSNTLLGHNPRPTLDAEE